MANKLVNTIAWCTALTLVGLALACNKGEAPQPETPKQAEPTSAEQPESGEVEAPGAQADKPAEVELIGVTEGLSPRHADVVPLLEKESCLPPEEPGGEPPPCNVQRVYSDETLYMLGEVEGTRRWVELGTLEPGAAARIEEIFAQICDGEDEVMGNDNGKFISRVHSEACTREFVVIGLVQGSLKPIEEVVDLINGAPPAPK